MTLSIQENSWHEQFMICQGWWAGTTGPPRTSVGDETFAIGCRHMNDLRKYYESKSSLNAHHSERIIDTFWFCIRKEKRLLKYLEKDFAGFDETSANTMDIGPVKRSAMRNRVLMLRKCIYVAFSILWKKSGLWELVISTALITSATPKTMEELLSADENSFSVFNFQSLFVLMQSTIETKSLDRKNF